MSKFSILNKVTFVVISLSVVSCYEENEFSDYKDGSRKTFCNSSANGKAAFSCMRNINAENDFYYLQVCVMEALYCTMQKSHHIAVHARMVFVKTHVRCRLMKSRILMICFM